MSILQNVGMIALMIFGFGFVVFWHELGHFLAAKWVGIKVEQFAVGFGQAVLAFRKGIGCKVGTTTPEYKRRIELHLAGQNITPSGDAEEPYTEMQMRAAADELGLGETEYRLNWIPLGGYVKMLGQDDMKPNADVADPRAYNRKSVAARMLVVSAGVIMNIILAFIGFTILFRMGFNVPPPMIGMLVPNSPAQKAGLQVGDRIVSLDGSLMHDDFNKLIFHTALLPEGTAVPIEYTRPGVAGLQRAMIQAERTENDKKGMLSIGVGQPSQLAGPTQKEMTAEEYKKATNPADAMPDRGHIHIGDTIVAINGVPVASVKDSYLLDQALQQSNGHPVSITVKSDTGAIRQETVTPRFLSPFSSIKRLTIAGMEPLPSVETFSEGSKARELLKPGDIVTSVTLTDLKRFPTTDELRDMANRAYDEGKKMTIEVLRLKPDGTDFIKVKLDNVEAAVATQNRRHGLGIQLTPADRIAIASNVLDDSPAKKAGIPKGAQITRVDDQPVTSWFEVRAALQKTVGDHRVTAIVPDVAEPRTFTLNMTAADVDSLKAMLVSHGLMLRELREPRQTDIIPTAASWGVTETRDFVLQFYVTLKRMWQGSISPGNMMGPIGIVGAGAHFAARGGDWLLWFLAMISANLAVVNFLPIPIVDGGLFTFLVIEKIQGRPASPKTQAVAQYVGLALLLSVFLMVTYNDISRFFLR